MVFTTSVGYCGDGDNLDSVHGEWRRSKICHGRRLTQTLARNFFRRSSGFPRALISIACVDASNRELQTDPINSLERDNGDIWMVVVIIVVVLALVDESHKATQCCALFWFALSYAR